MKYQAPTVLATVNATTLIQGSKGTQNTDNGNPLDHSIVAGYNADE